MAHEMEIQLRAEPDASAMLLKSVLGLKDLLTLALPSTKWNGACEPILTSLFTSCQTNCPPQISLIELRPAQTSCCFGRTWRADMEVWCRLAGCSRVSSGRFGYKRRFCLPATLCTLPSENPDKPYPYLLLVPDCPGSNSARPALHLVPKSAEIQAQHRAGMLL